jgi:DNA-binding NtrC family response regulator
MHFANTWSNENGKETVTFTEEALRKICSFYWAHNVAELKSVIENTIANTEGNSH